MILSGIGNRKPIYYPQYCIGDGSKPTGQFASTTDGLGSGTWATSNANRTFVDSGGSADQIGKTTTSTKRRRFGFFFTVPSGIKAAYSGCLNIILSGYTNTAESFNPVVYVSNTDDSAFGTGWWNNLNNGPYTGAYGLSTNQAIAIPGSVIAARAGGKLSIIIGEDKEMLGTGATGVARFGHLAASTLTVDYTYANAAARLAATGFVTADVGKVALQSDTGKHYLLTGTGPVWIQNDNYTVSAGHADVLSIVVFQQ